MSTSPHAQPNGATATITPIAAARRFPPDADALFHVIEREYTDKLTRPRTVNRSAVEDAILDVYSLGGFGTPEQVQWHASPFDPAVPTTNRPSNPYMVLQDPLAAVKETLTRLAPHVPPGPMTEFLTATDDVPAFAQIRRCVGIGSGWSDADGAQNSAFYASLHADSLWWGMFRVRSIARYYAAIHLCDLMGLTESGNEQAHSMARRLWGLCDVGAVVPCANGVLIIDRPSLALFDASLNLHSDDGPALVWGDQSFYAWHGRLLSEDAVAKGETPSFDDVKAALSAVGSARWACHDGQPLGARMGVSEVTSAAESAEYLCHRFNAHKAAEIASTATTRTPTGALAFTILDNSEFHGTEVPNGGYREEQDDD